MRNQIVETIVRCRGASGMLMTVALLLMAGWTASCSKVPDQLGQMPSDSILEFTGVVQWIDLEGGFWGIIRDESEAKYRPSNLPEPYQVHGMRVRVTCRRVQGGISIYQWGQEVVIESIEALSGRVGER